MPGQYGRHSVGAGEPSNLLGRRRQSLLALMGLRWERALGRISSVGVDIGRLIYGDAVKIAQLA